MKKIFTLLALTVLMGSASMAQDNRHGQSRDQSPSYQQDNGRGYPNISQNHGRYQNNDQVYRQERENGYGNNNERRYEDRGEGREYHNDYPVYGHERMVYGRERMESERYRRTRGHAWISVVFGKRWH